MEENFVHQDKGFRRVVVASTGIGIACMLGSLAAVRITRAAGLEFAWHWSILLIASLGVLWNWQFWKVVWQMQTQPDMRARRKLTGYLVTLALLGGGSFLYPIRFIEQSYWAGIITGLLTAGAFLGTMLYLIYRTVKGLEEIDATELRRNAA